MHMLHLFPLLPEEFSSLCHHQNLLSEARGDLVALLKLILVVTLFQDP